jgi:hypothetical protein
MFPRIQPIIPTTRKEPFVDPHAAIASQMAKPDGPVVVDPETQLDFLHALPVELMWEWARSPRHGC